MYIVLRYFPTCQVRVVRFYVSLFSSFSSSSSPPRRLPSPCPVAILCVQCGMSDLNCDPVSSVWRAGLQPDPVSAVWRSGPQPRSCVFSVACRTQLWSRLFSAVCRTSTAILRVQCGIPDLNRDYASSVWRAGPHLWWKGLVVVAERVVKEVVARCHKISQIECQEICLQEGQKELCQREWSKYVRNVRCYCYVWKKFKENVWVRLSETCSKICQLRMSARSGGNLK